MSFVFFLSPSLSLHRLKLQKLVWFTLSPSPFSFSGSVTESGWLLWLLFPSSKPKGCNKECWCVALCLQALQVQSCFCVTKPCWQNKTKIFQVTASWTLLPLSLFVSSYLCALPSFVPPPTHPSPSKQFKPFASFTYLATLQCFFASQILTKDTPTQPCICTNIKTCKNTDVAQHQAYRHTHKRRHDMKLTMMWCVCSNMPCGWGVLFFSLVLFWQSNEKPVGISQEFMAVIKSWLMPYEHAIYQQYEKYILRDLQQSTAMLAAVRLGTMMQGE